MILFAQPHPYQRSCQFNSLRATGHTSHDITSAFWAPSNWCGGTRETEKTLPSLQPQCFPGRQAVTSFHETNLRAVAVHSLRADPN